MRWIASAAAFALAVLACAAGSLPASAQPRPAPTPPVQSGPIPQNPQVEIAYGQPSNAAFRPIYERLRQRQVLEELRQFLAPLKLPRKLTVRTDQCGASYRPYQPGGMVTICYEYVAQLEQIATKAATPNGIPKETMIVGAFIQTLLHETARAVFDILELPVWGREDDAADRLAGFLMLQFGKDVARQTIIGTAWFFEASDRTWTGSDFASVASPESQRYFNFLCIAYGGDENTFKFLVDNNILPARRAARCGGEYAKLRFAFLRALMPYVDTDIMKRVQSMEILKAGDVR